MDCWAIIPAKPFHSGKSRLASLLGVDERAALNRRLFGRVLDAALGTFPAHRILVVTKDSLLLALMRGQGLHALEDADDGLSPALVLGCRHAMERGARSVVVMASDLPHVTTGDVAALRSAAGDAPGCVIAPDEPEQSTNALALTSLDPDFFQFGPGSFQAHIAAAKARRLAVRILRRPGLAVDLDTPEGYRRFAREQRIPSRALA
jgi:2-phospho-L-lactate/phosphoenolpyruvate guanylyltransferase